MEYTLRQWLGDQLSTQICRRNRAWDFMRAHHLEPCELAWNRTAIHWVDDVVYVASRNVKRDGELGARFEILTAEQFIRQCPPFGCEGTIAKLYSYMESSK